ncbi:elongation factor G [Aurantimonas marianensis]|uniref:Elongation factor G n=1 Tax=Aurantimonas marianensis TaxID=2920428 RepID=A0A9X2KHH0_9HYPH|nr:elongation factor G [Aurantimonas marianensis]MCP3054627.1 elongation factor G [Aurantimonas marianensis]
MRCFTVLGPAGAGKTTLVNRLAGSKASGERLEARDGLGIVSFEFMDEPWCAIDCRGDIEALPQVRPALLASDAAVIVVPPDPEVAVLAAPFFQVVEASGTPSVVFVNRIDEARARLRDVVAGLQDYCSHPIVLRQIPIREGEHVVGAVDLVSERAWQYREGGPSALVEGPESAAPREHEARAELLEHLSEFDDWLLEEIVEEREPASAALYAICRRALAENRAIPALIGSALHGAGVVRLMKMLRHEAPAVDALRQRLAGGSEAGEAAPMAVTFHAQYRKHLGKEKLIRAIADGVSAGASLAGGNLGALMEVGTGKPAPSPLPAGGIALALKSDHLAATRLLFADRSGEPPAWARSTEPMFVRSLAPQNDRDQAKLSLALSRIAEDDPGLTVSQEGATGALVVHLQGPMHLRRVLNMLAQEFGVTASDHAPDGVWRETISRPATIHHRHRKQTGGAGQFADVKLTVRPNRRGGGFSFEETVKGGAVPRNYIPAVEAGARDALVSGPLGFPVVDIEVTLTDGQYHAVDSSDFAFRAAGRAAVAEALAEGAPMLLQPIHEVAIHAPAPYTGALVAMISSLKGRVLGFEPNPNARGWDLLRARLPAGALEELGQALRSATQGMGWFESTFDHYEEVYGRDADRIIAMHGGARGDRQAAR